MTIDYQDEIRQNQAKRERLELCKSEQEILEMKLRNLRGVIDLLTSVSSDWLQTDKCFCLQVENILKNLMLAHFPSQPITYPEPTKHPKPFTRSQARQARRDSFVDN